MVQRDFTPFPKHQVGKSLSAAGHADTPLQENKRNPSDSCWRCWGWSSWWAVRKPPHTPTTLSVRKATHQILFKQEPESSRSRGRSFRVWVLSVWILSIPCTAPYVQLSPFLQGKAAHTKQEETTSQPNFAGQSHYVCCDRNLSLAAASTTGVADHYRNLKL